jgi:hypothetical protein
MGQIGCVPAPQSVQRLYLPLQESEAGYLLSKTLLEALTANHLDRETLFHLGIGHDAATSTNILVANVAHG